MSELCERLRGAMDAMRVADVHSHLGGGGRRQARTLADIVSYHWLSKELERAKGRAIAADPRHDPDGYLREVAPLFPAIRNTVNHYAFLGILRDLYGFEARTLTPANWQRADEAVRAHADDPSWLPAVLDRARIDRVLVAHKDGMPDDSERYAAYEYGEPICSVQSFEPLRAWPGCRDGLPRTPDALRAAVNQRVDRLVAEKRVRALHIWAPGTWQYRLVADEAAEPLIERLADGDELTEDEAALTASFSADAGAGAAARHNLVIQLFHGSIRYTPRGYNASYWNPRFLRSLALHFEMHPEVTYDLFLATRLPSHEAVQLSLAYPNLMVSGAWWHGFTPTTLLTFFRDRLEMLPNTAWNAFYSDGYLVEWVYGKLLVTKNRLARALADMADEGFLTEDDAVDIAQRVLWDNPVAAYGL